MKPVVVFLALLFSASAADAQIRSEVVVSGLTRAVAFIADPVFPDVQYIVQQNGIVLVLQNGALLPTPFLDLSRQITSDGERGLLGMAFSPNASSGRVFFNFTNTAGDTVVARFYRTAASPFVANPSSRFDLRWNDGNAYIDQPEANHNGGHLAFGPDGYLYIGLGDGGGANDQHGTSGNAQNPNTLLGKMLRIDVSVPDGDPKGYQIPADNPFLDGSPVAALGEIWDFGLRNPWRYSFDDPGRGGSGALFIGDVGQGAREEIDYAPAGSGQRNYGWRPREGLIQTPGISQTEMPIFLPRTDPILDYPRTSSGAGSVFGATVTGGFVYRGSALGANYFGRYFFADYINGRVWSFAWAPNATGGATVSNIVDHTSELGANGNVSSFGVDQRGELYLVIYGGTSGGAIRRIAPSGSVPTAPSNLAHSLANRSVTLNWVGVPGATQYRIEVGSTAGASNLMIYDTGVPTTTVTAMSVADGRYFVRVRASLPSGITAASNEIVINVGCTGPPSPPNNVTFAVSARTVVLSWNAPAGLSAIILEVGSAPGTSNLATYTLAPGTTTISGVVAPAVYHARLRSVSACGTSTPSSELTVPVP